MVSGEIRIEAGVKQWQRALEHAAAQRNELVLLRVYSHGYGCGARVYKVASASEPGSFRWVNFTQTGCGWVVQCDGPAGKRDVPCVHATLALREVGVLAGPLSGIAVPQAV